MPLRLAIADAVAAYGWGWYRGPHWPTSDQVVPWTEFWDWYKAIWSRRAKDRLNLAAAIGLAFAPADEFKAQQIRAAAIQEAFPDGE